MLLGLILISLLLSACSQSKVQLSENPAEAQIGYRRMFLHDGSDFAFVPFDEALSRAASVTIARLSQQEDTGEGYRILTFSVEESIYNPDDDKVIHLYESNNSLLPPYEDGKRYLLILSRATDVYYPHPYFHNFNGIQIAIDDSGRITSVYTSQEKLQEVDWETIGDMTSALEEKLASAEKDRPVHRYTGREVISEDYLDIAIGSNTILVAEAIQPIFENRYVREWTCRTKETLKGTAGKEITVLFPIALLPSAGTRYLLFLNQDGEYRISSKHSVIAASETEIWDKALTKAKATLLPEETEPPATPTPIPERVFTIQERFLPLLAQNEDVRGWITLNDTKIDYPILQSTDNDYYLDHNINKKKVVAGSIVFDYRVDIKNQARNIPIYGHNMKNGSQFHTLVEYKKKDWFQAHRILQIETLYETTQWDVYSVSVVDSSYNYVITMDFQDDTAYQVFLDDTAKRSIYPLETPLTLDDQILTMVTCSYEFDGARTIIHARRIQP